MSEWKPKKKINSASAEFVPQKRATASGNSQHVGSSQAVPSLQINSHAINNQHSYGNNVQTSRFPRPTPYGYHSYAPSHGPAMSDHVPGLSQHNPQAQQAQQYYGAANAYSTGAYPPSHRSWTPQTSHSSVQSHQNSAIPPAAEQVNSTHPGQSSSFLRPADSPHEARQFKQQQYHRNSSSNGNYNYGAAHHSTYYTQQSVPNPQRQAHMYHNQPVQYGSNTYPSQYASEGYSHPYNPDSITAAAGGYSGSIMKPASPNTGRVQGFESIMRRADSPIEQPSLLKKADSPIGYGGYCSEEELEEAESGPTDAQYEELLLASMEKKAKAAVVPENVGTYESMAAFREKLLAERRQKK